MRRLSYLLLLVPFVCCVFISCSSQSTSQQGMHPVEPIRPAAPTPPPPPKVYSYSEGNLNFLGLQQRWVRGLNDKDEAAVRDAYLLGNYVVIETKGLKLFGTNRISGTPEFIISLDSPCDVRCCQDEHNVYAVAKNVLYTFDKRGFIPPNGGKKYLDFPPSSQMIADETNIYMGCYDGKVRAVRTSLKYEDWQWTTGRLVTSRPAMGARLLYAASEDGYVYALAPEKEASRCPWKFKTLGPIRADVTYNATDHQVYAASTDGSLYALRDLPQGSREGQMAWLMAYATGAPIVKAPFVSGSTVYVINEKRECHAVSTQDGKPRWVVKDVADVLSVGQLNTYLLRSGGRILAVDTVSGDAHWVLDTAPLGVSRILSNPMDDGIYLLRDDGTTIFVSERKPQEKPVAKTAEKVEEAAH